MTRRRARGRRTEASQREAALKPELHPAAPSRWGIWPALGLILAIGLAAYFNSLWGAFVFDDQAQILNNERIRQLTPVSQWLGTRRPVVNLTLALNYAAGRFNPFGYHAVNLAIHLLAALTLFGLVRRTLTSSRLSERYAASAQRFALAVALIWAVHPLNTESVTYLVQRSESLMGLFYLLTPYCLIRSIDAPRRRLWLASAVACCALSMGCKAVAITAPVVVLLYDRTFLAGSFREALQRRWVFYLCLAGTWSVVILCGVARGVLNPPDHATPTVGFGVQGLSSLAYARSQPGVLLYYLRLSVWPHPLCLNYGWPVAEMTPAVVGFALVIAALLAGTVWGLRRKHWLGFAGAWFFLILAPTSSLIPIQDIYFEHRMYLPLAAVVAVGVAGIGLLLRRLTGQQRAPALGRRVLAVIVLILSVATILRNHDYRSRVAIWRNVVAQRPNNLRARFNYGLALAEAERTPEAVEQLRHAVRLNPNHADARVNLGSALLQQDSVNEAIEQYRFALAIDPQHALARRQLGDTLLKEERFDEAALHFEQALGSDTPADADAHLHCNLGVALTGAGRTTEAIDHYRRALELDPDLSDAHYNLAGALIDTGGFDTGVHHYREAIRLDPTSARAYIRLGNALAGAGKLDEAITEFRAVLQLPRHTVDSLLIARAHFNLGNALANQNKLNQAISEYLRATQAEPSYWRAHYGLGWACERLGQTERAIAAYGQTLRYKTDHAQAQTAREALLAKQKKSGSP